ncbi:MAG: ATP-binding protein [Bacilli bacterium]|nr:ATP-binding protein [Bacilli bacterium]
MKSKFNPFNPQFGQKPINFIGRNAQFNNIINGLSSPHSPYRTTLISGVRGSGKTSLLSSIADEISQKNDWIVINTSMSDNLLLNIINLLKLKTKQKYLRIFDKIKDIGIEFMGLSLKVNFEKTEFRGFQTLMIELLNYLKEEDIKVLLVIDEVKSDKQMRELASTYQVLLRENLDIALLMAGLPREVKLILNDDVLTFLNRATKIFLNNIEPYEFKEAYKDIFKENDFKISDDVLNELAIDTNGYPYIFQLIGYYIWESNCHEIDTNVVNMAIEKSKSDLFINVHNVIFKEISKMDFEFLKAMAQDDGPSDIADIVKRLNKTKNYISQYRARLLSSGLIEANAWGSVCYTLPYMKEYIIIRQHGLFK